VIDDSHNRQLDSVARRNIRRRARQLVGRGGIAEHDLEDLEQELACHLLKCWPSFEPAKGHPTVLVTVVVENALANILRDRQAQKRDGRRVRSLNVFVDVGEETPVELAQAIGPREHGAWRGRHPRSPEELAQLASDVARVLVGLPAKLRDLAERLKEDSLSQIARDTGVPRTTLYESVRRLRQIFERAGLGKYLESPPSA
jgi:RNA polymerase sigma-70 factor (ECF subfamily)